MKGLFIPEITAEMFRNGCLESIEALMAEGKIYDIDYEPEPKWIPVSERLPEKKTEVIYSLENHYVSTGYMTDRDYEGNIVELHWEDLESGVLIYPEAWMPLPEPYKEGEG